jgi:CubicO group peptidase (beta-lactamase class C family)
MTFQRNVVASRRILMKTALATGAALVVPAIGQSGGIATAAATSLASDDPADLFRELDAFVTARMAELLVPGVALGVIAGDSEHLAGFGVTNVESPEPVDAHTLFPIGSLTKTFTGTAMMRLVEQGRLDLESPVRTYLPDFRVADETVARQVTLRHLVTHTAGWFGDRFPETGQGEDALERYVDEMADLPQIAPLGVYFSYNNAAVAVAGRVIEVVTGQPCETALGELVLEPIGLDHTSFLSMEPATASIAVGHGDVDGEPVVFESEAIPRAANPIGGLTSSVADLHRYARFYLEGGAVDGNQLLSRANLRLMHESLGPGGANTVVVIDGVGVTWWVLSRAVGEHVIAHLGSSDGLESTLVLAPEREFALALLTNSLAGMALGVEVTNWALARFLGLEEQTITPIAVPTAHLDEYVGEYDFGDGVVLRIEERDGRLHLAQLVPGLDDPVLESPLSFVDVDRVAMEYLNATLLSDFVRDDEDQITWLRFAGRLCPRLG